MGGHDDWPFGQIDLLLSFANLLLGILVILFVSMHPPVKNNPESAKPPGRMMVCIYWMGRDDVDLWGGSPDDAKAVGYSRKNGTTIDLVRDDLGTDNAPHFECEYARTLPDGRWIFGIHGFSINDPSVPVKAEIRLGGDDGFQLLYEATLDIHQKQERTIAQFRLVGGKLVPDSLNTVFVPLRSAGA
jgi:hypothetical protein